jgi:hypothetical protein
MVKDIISKAIRHTKSSSNKIIQKKNTKNTGKIPRKAISKKEFILKELLKRQNYRCIITGMKLGERHEYDLEHLIANCYSGNNKIENLNLMSIEAHKVKTSKTDEKIKKMLSDLRYNEKNLCNDRFIFISYVRVDYTRDLLSHDNDYLIERLYKLKILLNYYIEEYKKPDFSEYIFTNLLEKLKFKIDELDKINLDNLSCNIEDDFNNFFEKLDNLKALLNK